MRPPARQIPSRQVSFRQVPFREIPSVSTRALTLVAGSATFALTLLVLACAGNLARADGDRLIPPHEIASRLAQRGYAVNDPVVRRGTAYLAHGTDKWGQRLRLVMDARNGEIIGLRVIGEGRAAPRDAPAAARP